MLWHDTAAGILCASTSGRLWFGTFTGTKKQVERGLHWDIKFPVKHRLQRRLLYNTNTIPKSQFSQMQCLFLAFSTAEHYLTDNPRDRHAQSDLSELPLTPGS